MLDKNKIPKHIAIIMDGNGRWAKKRNLPRIAGHKKGIEVVERIVEAAGALGVKVLSLYAFSTENWARPKKEINMLLRALSSFLHKNIDKLTKNNIKLRVMGEIDKFPDYVRKSLIESQVRTGQNSGLIVNLALNYGARFEIIRATKKIAEQINKKQLTLKSLDADKFSQFLYTKDLPDPDLLIRTSGEKRISNFMLWQLSYAEFYFCNKFWPDFNKDDFKEAIIEYQKRERRFGGTYAHTSNT